MVFLLPKSKLFHHSRGARMSKIMNHIIAQKCWSPDVSIVHSLTDLLCSNCYVSFFTKSFASADFKWQVCMRSLRHVDFCRGYLLFAMSEGTASVFCKRNRSRNSKNKFRCGSHRVGLLYVGRTLESTTTKAESILESVATAV